MWDFFTELNDFEIYSSVLRTHALSENRLCSASNFNVYSAFNQKNVTPIRWIKIDIRFGLLLTSTGLLKGKNCSTHSLFANEFRTMLPDVILTEDKITAYKSAIYPSGGVTSY